MVTKIEKYLLKLSEKQRIKLVLATQKIVNRELSDFSIKKLKGYNDLYRIRIGRHRIIFQDVETHCKIITVTKRDDTTYRSF